jgi:adenosylmethionine-8-amino-7-oxononanoate aminotransferase
MALPFVRALNISGLLIAIELDPAEGLGSPMQYGPKIRDHAYEHGLICRFNPNSIFLYPPLIISDEQVDDVSEILLAAFASVAGGSAA